MGKRVDEMEKAMSLVMREAGIDPSKIDAAVQEKQSS